jgi:hypothetical protein
VTTTQDAAAKADIARNHGQEVAQDVKGHATEVTQHAQDAAHDVAGTAAGQAQTVKDETVRQARNLAMEASDQLNAQAATQSQRLTHNLRDLGHELRQMAEAGNGGTASELAHQASDRMHQAAGYLEGREPSDLLDDVRDFARRRPGAFLAGAAVLGLIAGRAGRGMKDASGSAPSSTPSVSRARTSAPLTAPPGEPAMAGAMDDYSTGSYGTGSTTEGVGDGFSAVEGDASRIEPGIDLTQPYEAYTPEYGGSEVQR